MLLSMTGFGRGTASAPGKTITVDIKSLNSKQFDLSMRMPSIFRECELELRGKLASEILRGKVEMNISVESTVPEGTATINSDALAEYKRQITLLSDKLSIPLPSDWYATLLRLPDALTQTVHHLVPEEAEALRKASEESVKALTEFRRQEGEKLETFFTSKIENIARHLEKTEEYEALRVPKIREKLTQQLAKLDSMDYDKGRLEQELIFYIEKLDVNEEKLRLRSHLSYFLETMAEDPGQGKKLGFIAQEMGREINTLGSKSNEAGMQRLVVMMKDELEQIKEQVLNVL